MASAVALSRGVISSHLDRGLLPPVGNAVFKVLGLKTLEEGKKFRLAVEDGLSRYNRGLIVVGEGVDGDLFMPEKGDVVDFGHEDNQMLETQGRKIWMVVKYNVLSANPVTPSPSSGNRANVTPTTSGTAASAPRTPGKRGRDGSPGEGPSSNRRQAEAAKRSLFSPNNSASSRNAFAPVVTATHKVRDLNPYQNKHTVRVVAWSPEIRDVSTSRWQGKIFNVTLHDETGDIKATAFGDPAERFERLLKDGVTYFVSNAQVRAIREQRYNNTSHSYELCLNQNTTVHEDRRRDQQALPKRHYQFVSLSEISGRSDRDTLDVLAVAIDGGQLREVNSRNSGRTLKKREVSIVDRHAETTLTLWNEKAEAFDGTGKVVAVKGAQISEWNGAKTLSLSFNGSVEIEPDLPAAEGLLKWYQESGKSLLARQGPDMASASGDVITLEEARSDFLSASSGETARFYTVEVSLTSINTDTMSYKACPEDGCSKKLQEVGDDVYKCAKCGRAGPDFNVRYVLRLSVADCLGSAWATAFDESGRVLLGASAADMEAERVRDLDAFARRISEATFSLFLLRVSLKREMYNDEQRIKWTVVSAAPASRTDADRVARLKKNVKALQGAN